MVNLESTFMGALEVRTTETMSKPIVIVIMLERTDDEIGSFRIHSLHVHRFKANCSTGDIFIQILQPKIIIFSLIRYLLLFNYSNVLTYSLMILFLTKIF